MPKLMCPCGFVHDLSPIPDDGWLTVRDKDYESLLEAERVLHDIGAGMKAPSDNHPRIGNYDEAMARCVSLQGRICECPQCGTLLWRKPGSEVDRVYRPATSDSP